MKDMLDNEYNLRTVQIWLDDSFMEVEFNQPKDWDEDRFYEEAANYVLSNISIDILQEAYGKLQRYILAVHRKLQN